MPAGGLLALIRLLDDGHEWQRRRRWRMIWLWGGGVPSTKIRDGGTSQLLSGFGVLVNRSN